MLISQPFAAPLISPEEVFRGIVQAADQYRAGDDEGSVQFYIEHAQLSADVGKHLPVLSDRTTERYAKRISRMLRGRPFALITQDFQAFAPEVFLRFREFLRGFSGYVDLPRERTKAIVFLGDYRKTPWGLHVGNSSNFNFILEGRKRMRLWRDRFLRDKEGVDHSTDYGRHLHRAITLIGGPGDVIYWPSDCWHIGEPMGGLAVSVSLALFPQRRPSLLRDVWEQAVELTEARLEDREPVVRDTTRNGRARAIPKAARKTLAAFRETIDGPDLARSIKAAWLNQSTGSGFSVVPPPSPRVRLRSNDVLQADANFPIQWLEGDRGEFICSANGHAFSLFAHPAIIELLALLNRGEPCRVKSLIDRYVEAARVNAKAVGSAAKEMRDLLEKLHSLRALTVGTSY